MTRDVPAPKRGRRAGAAAGIATVIGCLLAGCGTATSSATTPAIPAAGVPTPLATSLTTPDGTWATVPMGHLDQPLDTFWQLLHLAPHVRTWTDQVAATAVATNGGLTLASAADTFAVGVRPTNRLRFSPLIATVNGGHSWTDGLIGDGLAERPDTLAIDTPGNALAIVDTPAGTQVLTSAGGLSGWTRLTDQAHLSATPAGRSCGVSTLTAVSYHGTTPVVGASCTRPGIVGLLSDRSGTWQPAGLSLPAAYRDATIQILALHAEGPTLTALLAVTGPGGATRLLTGWGTSNGAWMLSPPLQVPASDHLASYGPAERTGEFVFTTGAASCVSTIAGPGAAWHTLPAPPAGTATLAIPAGTPPQALAVTNATLTIWALPANTSNWVERQVLKVPIQYGSSG